MVSVRVRYLLSISTYVLYANLPHFAQYDRYTFKMYYLVIYSIGIIRLQHIHYDQLTRESDIFHFQTEIDLNEKTI